MEHTSTSKEDAAWFRSQPERLLPQPPPSPTIIRHDAWEFECDIKFQERLPLTGTMRAVCRALMRTDLYVDFDAPVDFGLGEPVTIDVFHTGKPHEALGLIAYSDREYDGFFFLYREKEDATLRAMLCAAHQIYNRVNGFLRTTQGRDFYLLSSGEVFPVSGFTTFWADKDFRVWPGFEGEGEVVSLSSNLGGDRIYEATYVRWPLIIQRKNEDSDANYKVKRQEQKVSGGFV